MAELERRQLADLTFAEVARALRALSSAYVERRSRLKQGAALSGVGKRAAFALYYGPLHYLLLSHVVSALGETVREIDTLLDLGCGTGASGAAWAGACARRPRVVAVDRNPWAVDEARRCYAALGVNATVRVGDFRREIDSGVGRRSRSSASAADDRRSGRRSGVLLAFALNEIDDQQSLDAIREALLRRADSGERILIVEPLAGFVAPWWDGWARAFIARGGRSDQWRVRLPVPPIVEKLGRAAGLDYRELRGRSLAV
jgi:SAM-dependent methyltransferase